MACRREEPSQAASGSGKAMLKVRPGAVAPKEGVGADGYARYRY